MMSTPPQLKVGGRYALGAMIGRGAGSTVFRGEDEVLKRPVAIKIVASEHVATYRAALAVSARLSHPAFVGIFDSLEFDSQFVIIQEYIGGQSFAELARAHPGAFQAAAIGQEIGLALVHAHRLGIAHGDLTPTAMFHDQWGAIRINNVALPPHTEYFAAAGAILATTPWTANVPSFRDDLRALGVALWLLLAGDAAPPAPVGGVSIGWEMVTPEVPAPLREVIERLIIPEHGNAYTSAEAAVGAERLYARAAGAADTHSALGITACVADRFTVATTAHADCQAASFGSNTAIIRALTADQRARSTTGSSGGRARATQRRRRSGHMVRQPAATGTTAWSHLARPGADARTLRPAGRGARGIVASPA